MPFHIFFDTILKNNLAEVLLKKIALLSFFYIFLPPANLWAAFLCEPVGGESPIQTIRNFFWIAVGAPGTAEYNCIIHNSSTLESIIPRVGFVGQLEAIRSNLSQSLYSILGSDTTCAKLPTSGYSIIGQGETVYYETPLNTVPATFPGAGVAYQKRLRYVNTLTNTTAKFEFNCGQDRMMGKRTKTFTSGKTFSVVTFYDNTTAQKYIDVYFFDDQNVSNDKLLMALAFRVNSAANTFELWQTRTGYNPDSANAFQAYRFSANVNYSTQSTSIHYHDISGMAGTTLANYTAVTNINSTSVVGVSAPGNGNQYDFKQGCSTDFNIASNTILVTNLCAGLPLSAPPATAFGDTFSMQSVQSNLKARLDAI